MGEGGVEVSANTKDGAWHEMTPGQHTATVRVFRNVTRKVSFHGRVARFNIETQTWEHDKCPHNHDKRIAARKCGEAAAKRLNREAEAKSFIDEHIVIIEVDI